MGAIAILGTCVRRLVLSLLGLALQACAARRLELPAPVSARPSEAAAVVQLAGQDDAHEPALVETADGSDWLRLVSGEWVKGEVVTLVGETLEFDSAELGDLAIDWDDVAELRTSRVFTLVLEGQVEVVGVVYMLDQEVRVRQEGGTHELARADVFRLVPGEPREANFWSGKVALGGTARSGNTDQLDYTTQVSLLRRTARSRIPIVYEAAYGELEGDKNTDHQRLTTRVDRFLGADLFVTPFGIELYRDRFQNLDLRVAPFAALGYRLMNRRGFEWNATAGLGYRYTRFDSVTAGADDTDESATGILGTGLQWDATSSIDVDFIYTAQIGLEDASDTNQGATLELNADLWWDFDLNVRLRWDRVGLPQAEADGGVPEKDDLQLSLGLSWEF